MAKNIPNLNTTNYHYLSDRFKSNTAFNEIDWTVASYLFHLEFIRSSKQGLNYEEKDYVHPSIATILKETNIKSRITVSKSLKRLADNGVITIEPSTSHYEANRYRVLEGWVNNSPIMQEVVESRSSGSTVPQDSLMLMLLEIRSELRNVKKQNDELLVEVDALRKQVAELKASPAEPTKEEPTLIVEEVVETRSIEEPKVTPMMSQRINKILERYDTVFAKKEEPKEVIEVKKVEPIVMEEVVEQRSMQVEVKKPKRDYSRYRLTDSILKCGTCSLMYLCGEELYKEVMLRRENGIDPTEVLKIINSKHKRYSENPKLDREGFLNMFNDEVMSRIAV